MKNKQEKHIYNLEAICLHTKENGGHFTAQVISNGVKYFCDDESVQKRNINYNDPRVYILSYKL